MTVNIRLNPEPRCPDCYEKMVLRHRRSDNKPFWGCRDWPECRGTRNIMPDGTPEEDDEFDEDGYDKEMDDWHDGWPGNFGDR